MAPRPSVTVVIATHNRPQLLRAALHAVFRQNFDGDCDAIVVFDQSSIDQQLIDEFGSNRLRVIENSRTPGLAGARNSGIDASSGEWIAFCDDDDEWHREKLARQFSILNDHPDATVLASGIVIQYGGKEFVRIPAHDVVTRKMLLTERVVEAHPSSIVVRRSTLLDEIGYVDESIPGGYGEDYEWILRAALTQKIAVSMEPLVTVKWHKGSYFADRWRNIYEAMDYLIEKHPDFKENRRGHAMILGRQAFALAALGERRRALSKASQALRRDWRDRRAYVAAMVAIGMISAPRVIRWANSRGRGV